MSIVVNIAGTNYNLPTQGGSPPWGGDLSDIIQALISVANTTLSATDIATTNFTLTNNQSATSVTGLSFDTTTVRSAIISYCIYISTNSNEFSECGTIYITYKNTANSWELVQTYAGSSNTTFTITTAGQVQIATSNVSGTGYSGKLTFNAKTFVQ